MTWASTSKAISSFKVLLADVHVPPITNFREESKKPNDPFVNLGFWLLAVISAVASVLSAAIALIAVLKR